MFGVNVIPGRVAGTGRAELVRQRGQGSTFFNFASRLAVRPETGSGDGNQGSTDCPVSLESSD